MLEKIKIIKKIFLNIFKLKKHFTKHNLNKLIYHIKKGNYSLINEKIGFFTNTELKNIELNLIEEINLNEPIIFKKIEKPKVSIIIPVYNQFEYTYKCLKSILKNTDNVEYEIIIADDVSSDETININKYIQNITVVRNEKNLGFLLNCNNAAKYATGEYLHFLNNDTQVERNWLSSLVELIERDSNIGMVGSKLVYPDGRQQEAGGIIWNDASGWNFGRLDDPAKPEYNYVKEVDYISGASIMLSKKLWFEIGGFDERYIPAYFEDSDLAFEVRKHGYKVMFQPKSIVVHFEGISHGTDTSVGIKAYQIKNREKFIEKWKFELEKDQFSNAENVFLARDRSRNKKHILFIDHYVPHFDQDAGSRTVFAYLKLFISENYSVKFIGDNFFPHQPYTEELEKLGIETLYGNWYSNNWKNWIEEQGKYFNYIFMNRPHISEKYIDIMKKETNAKIIYYGHDLHYLRDTREYLLTNDKDKLKDAQIWRDREFNLMRKADISFYPSDIEVEEILNIEKEINVKSIPAYLFENFNNKKRIIKDTKDLMFVGGFGHTPNIDAILWFVNTIWSKLKKDLPELKLYIIGSKPTQEIKNLSSNDIIVTGFISDEELFNYYKECRIAIIPLRYGAGIKGKVVEALYEQIPIITTNIGAEGLVNAENYMLIEDEAEDFKNKILEMYNNLEFLQNLSDQSNEYCKKYFSYASAKNSIQDIFDFNRDVK